MRSEEDYPEETNSEEGIGSWLFGGEQTPSKTEHKDGAERISRLGIVISIGEQKDLVSERYYAKTRPTKTSCRNTVMSEQTFLWSIIWLETDRIPKSSDWEMTHLLEENESAGRREWIM